MCQTTQGLQSCGLSAVFCRPCAEPVLQNLRRRWFRVGRRLLLAGAGLPVQGRRPPLQVLVVLFLLPATGRRPAVGAQLEQLVQLLPLLHLAGQHRQLLAHASHRLGHRARRCVRRLRHSKRWFVCQGWAIFLTTTEAASLKPRCI